MPKTTETQKELKRRTILEATRRLLIRQGFAEISMEEVASEAGMAKGTLFLYFESKETLLLAVYENMFACLGEKLGALPARYEQPLELLMALFITIIRHLVDNRDFTAVLTTGKFTTLRKHENVRSRLQANRRQIINILDICARKGILKVEDAEYEAASLFGLCRSGAMLMMASKKYSLDECAEKSMKLFLKGTGTHEQ